MSKWATRVGPCRPLEGSRQGQTRGTAPEPQLDLGPYRVSVHDWLTIARPARGSDARYTVDHPARRTYTADHLARTQRAQPLLGSDEWEGSGSRSALTGG